MSQGTGDGVDVEVHRLFADLRVLVSRSLITIYSQASTYRVALGVVDKKNGQVGIPPLVVRFGNHDAVLQSDGISVKWTLGRVLILLALVVDLQAEEFGPLILWLPGSGSVRSLSRLPNGTFLMSGRILDYAWS